MDRLEQRHNTDETDRLQSAGRGATEGRSPRQTLSLASNRAFTFRVYKRAIRANCARDMADARAYNQSAA
jgi:hypothetical protein